MKVISTITAFLFLSSSILQAAPTSTFFDQAPSVNNKISNISELISGIPSSVGEVESSWQPKEFFIGKQPLVILFQEVHSNPETQVHIASALNQIHTKLNSLGITQDFAIGVEGAPFRKTDVSLFEAFPIKTAVKDISRSFLSEGKIDGAKYMAINLKNPGAQLFGLENEDLYQNNLSAYRSFLKHQNSAKETSQSLLKSAREVREKVYTQSLLELQQGKEKLEKNPGYLPIYLRTLEKLGKKKAVLLSDYPQVLELKTTLETSERKVSLKSNPLSHYSSKKIISFFDELHHLTETLEQSLSRSVDEKLLVKISKYALLLEKISSLSLTRDEYYQFKKHYHSMKEMSDWRSFNDLLSRRKESPINIQRIENLLQDLKPAISFYELALKRDWAMSQSIEKLTKVSESKIVAAVTGGFHRDGISRHLMNKNIPFIVISAKSSGKWDSEAYWKQLSENRKTLDEQTLRPAEQPIVTETVLSLVGSIPFYLEEAAKSQGSSLGASMTHDQIYEAVTLQYLKDIESKKPDASQKDQLRAIKILKKIVAEIKARRERGETIQLNSFRFDTDTAQLAIFVQRLNSKTNAWEPQVPETLDGFSPVKMADKTDLNGQIAPGYQHFRLKVFGKQKPGVSSSASTPAANVTPPITAQPVKKKVSATPAPAAPQIAERPSEDQVEEEAAPEEAPQPVSLRKKAVKVAGLLLAAFFAIAAISDGLKYRARKNEENRIRQNITSSEQMIRKILDEIWKKNFREAENLLASAENDPSLSLISFIEW